MTRKRVGTYRTGHDPFEYVDPDLYDDPESAERRWRRRHRWGLPGPVDGEVGIPTSPTSTEQAEATAEHEGES